MNKTFNNIFLGAMLGFSIAVQLHNYLDINSNNLIVNRVFIAVLVFELISNNSKLNKRK